MASGGGQPPASAGDDRPVSPASQFPVVGAAVHQAGPPAAHTGGFEEPTCRACHAEFDLNVGGTLEVQGLPDVYEGGRTYVVTLVLGSTEMGAAGFQAAIRYGEGGNAGGQAGTLRPVDHRTTVMKPEDGPEILYVQQTAAGSEVSDPGTAAWSFEWSAPPGGTDPVVLDAAANSANGDNSPLGDLVYTLRREVAGPAG